MKTHYLEFTSNNNIDISHAFLYRAISIKNILEAQKYTFIMQTHASFEICAEICFLNVKNEQKDWRQDYIIIQKENSSTVPHMKAHVKYIEKN